jgi:hypothetical protein
VNSHPDGTSDRSSCRFLKQFWWVPVFYGMIGLVIFLQQRTHIELKEGTVLLVVLLLLPLIIPRLARLEYGGMKLELRELRNEVVETKHEVRKEVSGVREQYRHLSERLAKVVQKSEDYLKPQSLEISDEKARALRESINLSDQEVDLGLESLDPNLRVPAYIEMQVRARPQFVAKLIDSYWLEQLHARRYKQTRPMWQLLLATDFQTPDMSPTERQRARLLLTHTLEFFRSDSSIDPGNQCKIRIEQILQRLT